MFLQTSKTIRPKICKGCSAQNFVSYRTRLPRKWRQVKWSPWNIKLSSIKLMDKVTQETKGSQNIVHEKWSDITWTKKGAVLVVWGKGSPWIANTVIVGSFNISCLDSAQLWIPVHNSVFGLGESFYSQGDHKSWPPHLTVSFLWFFWCPFNLGLWLYVFWNGFFTKKKSF